MTSAKITRCKHYFHGVCLRKWLYVQDRCPLCHEIIMHHEPLQNEKQVEPIDGGNGVAGGIGVGGGVNTLQNAAEVIANDNLHPLLKHYSNIHACKLECSRTVGAIAEQ